MTYKPSKYKVECQVWIDSLLSYHYKMRVVVCPLYLLVLTDLVTGTGKVFHSIAGYLQTHTPRIQHYRPRFRMLSQPPTGFDTMLRDWVRHAARRQRSKQWALIC